MEYGKTLIDYACATMGGSRYQIASEIDVDESFLSKIYTGKKPIPPLIAAKIAMCAGLEPREAALMALVDSERDVRERVQLRAWFDLPRNDADEQAAANAEPHQVAKRPKGAILGIAGALILAASYYPSDAIAKALQVCILC